MKKRALKKDFYMEIKKTANRFLSIFLIVALGVAFFSGIRASKPDMQLSADRFFDESNLMDIRVLCTYGLTEEDMKAVSSLEGIKEIKGIYSYDALSFQEEKQNVLKMQSLSADINTLTLSEGRLPEKSGECVIDKSLQANSGYKLGETIEVQSGNEDPLEDTLKRNRFTIVGVGFAPYYLSLERESSQIGNGKVNGFVMIPEENFALDYFTEFIITVEGAKELISYRDNYIDLVDRAVGAIEDISDARIKIRYQSIMDEAKEEIAAARKELADAKKEADEKLLDAAEKIEDAKKKIADGKKEIKEGEKELKDGKEKLAKARKDLEDGKKAYNEGKQELEKARQEYGSGWKEFEQKKAEAKKAEERLLKEEKALTAARAELDEKKAQLNDNKPYLSEEEYEAMLQEILAYEQPILSGEKELLAAKEKLEAGNVQLEQGARTLNQAKREIESGEAKLRASNEDIVSGEKQIEENEEKIKENEKKIADAKKEIKKGEKKLTKNEKKYEDAKEETEQEIAEAEEELDDAEQKIADIKEPEWYVLDREKIQVLAEYGQNADRIGAIGEVFPVIFFLVAALVCLTTMTRMVEEQRTQIGALKAIGYKKWDISKKYLYYAGIASITGGFFGAVIGQKVLPIVIISAYRILYTGLPYTLAPFNFYFGLSSILVVCACTILAAYFSCSREMHESAAQLMRPEPPKPGKRVILERIPFIWKHLSFTKKASVRNLFRYKKRFFMTVVGIAGCMSLLLVGFGIRDSIHNIAVLQYDKLFHYSGSIKMKEDESSANKEKLLKFLQQDERAEDFMPVLEKAVTISSGEIEKDAFLVVPQRDEDFDRYVNLKSRTSDDIYQITTAGDGIILTEKAAVLLGVSAGDKITLKMDEFTKADVTIRAVTENYSFHYVYMLKDTWQSLFESKMDENVLYYNMAPKQADEKKFGEDVLSFAAASEITYNDEQRGNIEDMLDSLDVVVWVLIISAGLLAFVVLFNLNNININERKRELATLKVLGFYDMEVASYVYRENLILTAIGTLAGIFLGIVLHKYVVLTAEIDILMFGRQIAWQSYLYSAGLTMLFSVLINFIMYFKLKKIDMVESLKSIE